MRLVFFVGFLALLFLLSPFPALLLKGASPLAFQRLQADAVLLPAFGSSLFLAFVTALLSSLFGLLIAAKLPSLSARMRARIMRSFILPMVIPEIAIALAYLVMFVKLKIPLGWGTLIASHVAFSLSYSVFILKIKFETLDRRLVDAARDLGAEGLALFRHAIWPQVAPALAASFASSFLLSLDDFFVSFFVKGIEQKLLPIQIYSSMRIRIGPEIYAISLLLFVLTISLLVISHLGLRGHKKKGSS